MKLIGIGPNKVRYKNSKRGSMEILTPGQEIELDVKEDADTIFGLISDLRAVPVDPEFIPVNGRYVALRPFSYDAEGKTIAVHPQEVVKLDRKQACEFMVRALVRPENLSQWSPSELLKPKNMPTGEAKKMYDDEILESPNWVQKNIRRDL
jgi:hypothetical protein